MTKKSAYLCIDIFFVMPLMPFSGVPKDTPIVTPLMDFVRQKRAAKGGSRVICCNPYISILDCKIMSSVLFAIIYRCVLLPSFREAK